jgi:hypothetical protein
MARPQLILPQADAACGKTFFADRRTADGHRIALEVWNRATGRVREGHRLAVYRCKRCAGFHVRQTPIERIPIRPLPLPDRDGEEHPFDEREYDAPHAECPLPEPAWA